MKNALTDELRRFNYLVGGIGQFYHEAALLLPLIFKIDGIWASAVVAEFAACVITVIFIITKKKKYGY